MANLTIAESRTALVEQVQSAGNIIRPLLPKNVTFEMVLAQMEKHLRENPKLLECTQGSLFWSFVHAAEVGLSVGNLFGEGYIVPFKKGDLKRAQFIPGYKGLIKLAYQSKLVSDVNAWVIYDVDVFEADLGKDENPITYKPRLMVDGKAIASSGNPIGVYTKIKLSTGGFKHDVMPLWKLERIRQSAPGGRNGDHPWNTNTDEMYRKTGLRHALKDIPKSNEIDRALLLAEHDEREFEDEDIVAIPGLDDASRDDGGRASQSRARVQSRAQAGQLPAAKAIDTTGTPVQAEPVQVKPAPQPPAPPPAQQQAPKPAPAQAQPPAAPAAPKVEPKPSAKPEPASAPAAAKPNQLDAVKKALEEEAAKAKPKPAAAPAAPAAPAAAPPPAQTAASLQTPPPPDDMIMGELDEDADLFS